MLGFTWGIGGSRGSDGLFLYSFECGVVVIVIGFKVYGVGWCRGGGLYFREVCYFYYGV